MPYDKEKWIKRCSSRSDITGQVTHLTKDTKNNDPLVILLKILREKKLIGSTTSSGFIVGKIPAVCFQEAPLYSICQNVAFEAKEAKENKRPVKYSSFGLMFQKDYIYNNGGRPVLYEETNFAKSLLPSEQWWRIVKFDLSNTDNMIDWTHEREWRIANNFEFNIARATVLVPNPDEYKRFYALSKIGGEDVASMVRTVISVGAVFI